MRGDGGNAGDRDAGDTVNPLLQALLALVIGGMALNYGMPMLLDAQIQPAQNDAGNQVAQMQAAGAAYIRNHAAELLQPPASGGLAVGATLAVTPAQLQTDGDLAWSFIDGNVFGQKHILVITQLPAPYAVGTLDGMVYTYGGDQISDPVAIRVAQAGPAGATVVLASDAANFEGAAGGESVPVAYYQQGGALAAAPGHIGAHILPAGYSAEAPFLNRYATGNLDDNTMHTAEYMSGNNLEMAAPGATVGGGNIDMAGGNVNAAGSVTATQKVVAPVLADPNGVNQVTPAGTSQINNLNASGNVTVTGTVQASIYTY